jgi:antitoxin StbD
MVDETALQAYKKVMNAPLKPPVIEEVLASACVSISNLKANPAAVIAEAQHRQVAILNRNKPVAYVISPEVWDRVLELLEDAEDERIVAERLQNPGELIEVSIDEL